MGAKIENPAQEGGEEFGVWSLELGVWGCSGNIKIASLRNCG